MSRPNPFFFALFLVAIILVMGGAVLASGAFFVSNYEVDTLHMVQILLRLDMGQAIHHDFRTPIGTLAFAPILAFMKAGFGIDKAFPLGQMLVAAVLIVPVWRAGMSRMRGIAPWLFGLVTLALVLAVVFGSPDPALSVSMYYNRWAWALAFAAIALAVLPDLGAVRRPGWDGLLIGALMGALAVLKATYFIAFAVPVFLALVMLQTRRTLLFSVLGGLLVAVVVTALEGVGYWMAYVADLKMVAGSELRAAPGVDLREVLSGPKFLGATLSALFGAIFLRQSGVREGGLLILLLLPAFAYVTYQNFGNDPQWLMLLVVLLLALRPAEGRPGLFGWDTRTGIGATALVAAALAFPSAVNTFKSPLRHLAQDPENYVQLLPGWEKHAGLLVRRDRQEQVMIQTPYEDRAPELIPFGPDERADPVVLEGITFPRCETTSGVLSYRRVLAAKMAGLVPEGAAVLEVDTVGSTWVYGPYRPIMGAAPWYYGGLPGIEDVTHVLVPMCPLHPPNRTIIVDELKEFGLPLNLLETNDFFALFEVAR